MKVNLSKLSEKGKGFINNKTALLVLSAMLLVGITLSLVQITQAGVTGPHNPGHTWATIDKPADCSSGNYVYGANDSGWLCSSPGASQNCSTDGVCSYVYATYDVVAGDDVSVADQLDVGDDL